MELLLVSFNLGYIWDNGDGTNCFLHRSGMVLEKLRTKNGCDLFPGSNACPDSDVIRVCKEAAQLPLSDTTQQIPVTWHNFGKNLCEPDAKSGKYKIDYIFAAGAWKDSHNGIYLSDHFPIFLKK